MKFDTNKCSPIFLQSPNKATPSSGRPQLNGRDSLAWRNPNQYIIDDEESDEESRNDGDDDITSVAARQTVGRSGNYGRHIEYIPRLFYTPVKISTRTTTSGGSSGKPSRTTITDCELEDLNASLANLCFGENKKSSNSCNNESSLPQERGTMTAADNAQGSTNHLPMGRFQTNQVDPKTGETVTIWKSARKSKKIVRS